MSDSEGRPIEPVPPEPPLSQGELQNLDFEAKRIASPAVQAAVQQAQEAHTAWIEAVRNRDQIINANRMYTAAGNLRAVSDGDELMSLLRREDEAAEAAKAADAGLAELMISETTGGDDAD